MTLFSGKNSWLRRIVILMTAMSSLALYAQFIPPADFEVPEKKPQKEPVKTTEKAPEKTSSKAPVRVSDIVAVAEISNTPRVRISFTPLHIGDDFLVLRSAVPITDIQKMRASQTVGVVPAGTGLFYDVGVKDGPYYYAVVSRSDFESSSVQLSAGKNYTGTPVYINRPQTAAPEIIPEVKAEEAEHISLLFAQLLDDGSVRLNWRGVTQDGISYVVYRSQEVIADAPALERAVKLTVIDNGAISWTDSNIDEAGDYYYAVMLRTPEGEDIHEFREGENFTQVPVHVEIREVPVTRSVRAFIRRVIPAVSGQKASIDVAVEWRDVNDARALSFRYIVYRSPSPVLNEEALAKAVKIAEVKGGVEYLLDSELENGSYYYAIVSVSPEGLKSTRFLSGLNSTERAVEVKLDGAVEIPKEVTEQKPEEVVAETVKPAVTPIRVFREFASYPREKVLLLNWSLAEGVELPMGSRIKIYRFTEKPALFADIIRGELISQQSPSQTLFEDVPRADGLYYYGIFLETPSGLTPRYLTLGENLIGPVAYSTKKKEVTKPVTKIQESKKPVASAKSSAIDDTIRTTFLQKDYRRAVADLKSFRESDDPSVQAKAFMYTGMSLYYLGEYEKALNYFVHPLVVQAYPEHSSKWYKKTLKHI